MFEKIAVKISNYNRARKYDLFISSFNPDRNVKILDVGASEKEYQDKANILEKSYPYPENITALGIENFREFNERYPKVRTVEYRGGKFPFKDGEFDICWSNAVIEHVRPGEREMFMREIKRVAKAAFITTPNRCFPFEVHTKLFLIHWLPKNVFDKMLNGLGKKWASGNYMNLMTKTDIVQLLERCGITKFRIIHNRFLGLTMNFVIIC